MDTTNRLTSREAEVLQLLARGCTYSQVGDRLGVSLHTVESHVKNVYRKLEVHSARAAVWRATELRLFGEPEGLQATSQQVS
jgi:DNA-binding NarL/FixJ family response regulator